MDNLGEENDNFILIRFYHIFKMYAVQLDCYKACVCVCIWGGMRERDLTGWLNSVS